MPTPVSPRDLARRKFQAAAAATLDKQAGVIGELVEAMNQTNESARVTREFIADQAARIDKLTSELGMDHCTLMHNGKRIYELEQSASRMTTFWGRLRWLFTGR